MGIFDGKVFIDKNGDIKYHSWIAWVHVSKGVTHCPVCLALDKCWFDSEIMPQIPQHDHCHCTTKYIADPSPEKGATAECDIRKFRDYIFADKYAWNGKRDLFELLGFRKEDSEYLKTEYEKQGIQEYCKSNYKLGKLNENGQRINVTIRFEKKGRSIRFDSGWMVRPFGKLTINTPLAD